MPRPSPPSSPSESEPRSKRHKPRIERACQSCVRSKTRCEEFVPGEGCFRCRRRRDHCSFLDSPQSVPAPMLAHTSSYPTPSAVSAASPLPPDVVAKLNTVDELAERVRRLEHALILAQPSQTPLSSLPSLPQSSTGTVPTPLPTKRKYTRLLWASDPIIFDERMFSIANEGAYPDAVALGLLTREQADIAFQMFKHRLALLLPLHPLTLATTRAPDHPFVVLAILRHVPSLAPAMLQELIDQSILHALSGAASEQVILALLVLSIAPIVYSDKEDGVGTHITPLRAISLAYEMGASLGLEERTKAAIGKEENWGESWYAARVDEVLLWETVKSRHTLLTMMTTRTAPSLLSQSQVQALPVPLRLCDSARATIQRLKIEDELINIVRDSFQLVGVMEAQSMGAIPDGLDKAEPVWREAFRQLDKFMQAHQSQTMVLYDTHAIQCSLVIRVSVLYQQLPSVISPSLKLLGLAIAGGFFVRSSAALLDLIHSVRDSDAPPLPANILIILAIVVVGAHRTNWFVKEHHIEHDRPVFEDVHLKSAHECLDAACPALSRMVDTVCAQRIGAGWRRDGKRTGDDTTILSADMSAIWDGFVGLPDDWLNIDFSTWPSV